MGKSVTIPWQDFSVKHKEYIRECLGGIRMAVAEGAIRSGKTIDHCIVAAAHLEICEDKIHLASGSTIANAKLNIGSCNGFGLENLFRGRCRWGKYKDNECLYIYTQTGEKVVIFAGGGKADSYKKILGNSYGLWIATEINEHYDSDNSKESFIKVAMGRQAAAIRPLTLWDLNPSAPKHKIYSDYIDRYRFMSDEQKRDFGGFVYEHFTIADNLAISEQRRREIENQYDKRSIWYRRDILGQRCVAEGLIYPEYADRAEDWRVDELPMIAKVNVGVDFGGSGSATTFVATGFTPGYGKVVPFLSERHAERLNPDELNKKFALFCEKVYNVCGRPFTVYADSAEQILIRGLIEAVARYKLHCNVKNAKKSPILERIRLVDGLIATRRLQVWSGAKTVEDAIASEVWDDKHADTRLDDGTSDIDTVDAFEYSVEPETIYLVRA